MRRLEIGEAGDAKQAQAGRDLVLKELQHAQDAFGTDCGKTVKVLRN